MPADEYLHLAHKKIKNFYDIRPANTRKKLQETPPRIHKLHGKEFSVPPPNDWDKDLRLVNEDGDNRVLL